MFSRAKAGDEIIGGVLISTFLLRNKELGSDHSSRPQADLFRGARCGQNGSYIFIRALGRFNYQTVKSEAI